MAQNNPENLNPEMSTPLKQAAPVRNTLLNAFLTVTVVPAFLGFFLYGCFAQINLVDAKSFKLNDGLLVAGVYFILESIFSLANNKIWVPRLKSHAKSLPEVSIQVIGRSERPEVLSAVLHRIKMQRYPPHLLKKIVLCIDGNDEEGKQMIEVFREIFPQSEKLYLSSKFSTLSNAEKEELLQKKQTAKYLVITQPQGGRREAKYTAFHFSMSNSDYVLNCDSDTLLELDALNNLASTAAGYNALNPEKKPCGGVVGRIRVNNALSFQALQMELSYWYSFCFGKGAESLFHCVTSITGAMGFYHCESLKPLIQNYCNQTFFGIKCVYGEDRHLTTGLIENNQAILYDNDAEASTETPDHLNELLLQQSRWFKGFYRETMIMFPKMFTYSWFSILSLSLSFMFPFLSVITILSALLNIEQLLSFIIFVSVLSFGISLRGIIGEKSIKYLYFTLFPIFSFLLLVPVRVISQTQCICSDMIASKNQRSDCLKIVPAYLWMAIGFAVLVGAGFLINLSLQHENISLQLKICSGLLIVCLAGLAAGWFTWGWQTLIPQNMSSLQRRYKNPSKMDDFNAPTTKDLKQVGETQQEIIE